MIFYNICSIICVITKIQDKSRERALQYGDIRKLFYSFCDRNSNEYYRLSYFLKFIQPLIQSKSFSGYKSVTYKSGDVYVGHFLNGKYHGKGAYIERKSGNVYVGDNFDGKRTQGTFIWQNGDIYVGTFAAAYGANSKNHEYDILINSKIWSGKKTRTDGSIIDYVNGERQ